MELLKPLPEDYLQTLLPCFGVLKNCNILLFDHRPIFWKILPYFYILPVVVAYVTAVTVYLMKAFKKGNVNIDELVYVVPVYIVNIHKIIKTRDSIARTVN